MALAWTCFKSYGANINRPVLHTFVKRIRKALFDWQIRHCFPCKHTRRWPKQGESQGHIPPRLTKSTRLTPTDRVTLCARSHYWMWIQFFPFCQNVKALRKYQRLLQSCTNTYLWREKLIFNTSSVLGWVSVQKVDTLPPVIIIFFSHRSLRDEDDDDTSQICYKAVKARHHSSLIIASYLSTEFSAVRL